MNPRRIFELQIENAVPAVNAAKATVCATLLGLTAATACPASDAHQRARRSNIT